MTPSTDATIGPMAKKRWWQDAALWAAALQLLREIVRLLGATMAP